MLLTVDVNIILGWHLGVFVFQMKNVPEMGGADGGAET